MKKIVLFACILLGGYTAFAQCNNAKLNWDNRNFYYYATTAPYGNGSNVSYITAAMANSLNFTIGKTSVNFSLDANITSNGENALFTQMANTYGSGQNVQFTTKNNAGVLTLTFATEVSNVQFSIYDLDLKQKLTVDAKNASNAAQSITLSSTPGSYLTLSSNPGTSPTAIINNTTNYSNDNK